MPCFLTNNGHITENTLIVRRTAALGDTLCSTIVADRLIELGYEVVFQSHPSTHCILRRHGKLSGITEPNGTCHINLDGAYEAHPQRKQLHFHEMFFERAHQQIHHMGIMLGSPFNSRPTIRVSSGDKADWLNAYGHFPRPWIFICPRSESYAVRRVPDAIWESAASKIQGTVFWTGMHPAPKGIVDLGIRHVDPLINALASVDLMVSVDTGPLHIAAALGIPCVAIGQSSSPELHLSDQRDFVTIEPKLNCLNCQTNICPLNQWEPPCQHVDPDFIAQWVNARSNSIFGHSVSAIVAVYRPDEHILNRCLDSLIPQVDEIIVVKDRTGIVPHGSRKHDRIRYVSHRLPDIGYGRKANYGARNSNGRYLLFCNDDCFLNPGAVQKMKEQMKPGVGMVAPILRFGSGRIQHAGMVRSPDGGVGFGHVDYGQYEPTFKESREVECVTGACLLIDRQAFYKIGAFNESYYLYCEDTDLCMKMRRNGYKIVFCPEASGVHDEHLSTRKTNGIMDIMRTSNAIFGRSWASYFAHNKGNSGLGNFSYLEL